MMKYDFTSIIDRKGKDALAFEVDKSFSDELSEAIDQIRIKEGFSVIPMWVADMNFPTLPAIQEKIIERAKHPAFGYFLPSNEYYEAIIRWQTKRHHVTGLQEEHIGYENGVLGGVVSALNVLCSKGDKVLIHAPTYIGFSHALIDNGYRVVLSHLKQDEKGVWRMDYEDMEEKLRKQKIHVTILCSPHNPCGRVWERWELEKAMALFQKHDVFVISDEIWSDLVLTGHRHIPTQMVSEEARQRTIALYAPSKTFNLSGLIGSYHIIYNRWIRDRMEHESKSSCYNNMNVLSMHALIGAYQPEGERWVDELCQVLTQNAKYAYRYMTERFQGVRLAVPEGTYMLFPDCTDWCTKNNKTLNELLISGIEVGVIWQDGRPFHGANSIRLNLALPHSLVTEAFYRLDRYVFNPNKS